MSSVVIFAAVVLCRLATILFNVRRSLSVNVVLRPLLLFADVVLPCFVQAVITVNTVARETLNRSAVFITDASANRTLTICPFSKSDKSPIDKSDKSDKSPISPSDC